MTSFFEGLGYNFTGIGFFCNNRRLWKWVLIPFVLDLLIGITLFVVYVKFFAQLQAFFAKPFAAWDVLEPEGLWQHLQDLGYWFLRGLMHIVVFFLSLVLLWLTILFTASLINGPFYEMLCEKVLILKGRREDFPFSWRRFAKEAWHAAKIGFWRLVFLSVPGVFILLLSVMPGIGLLFTLVYFIYLSWCSAFGIVAYAMTLLEIPFRDMFRLARQNFGLFLGFGLPALLPVVGPMLISFQIVGGTLMYVEKSSQN